MPVVDQQFSMYLYCQHHTSRVQYMAGWLGERLFGKPLMVTQEKDWQPGDLVLNYSHEIIAGTYQLKPQGLLFEKGIISQQIVVAHAGAFPQFFQTGGDHPFDLLAASFYLLSRYEEYLPYEKDEYGRYGHKNSLAFKEGFLNQPLVDIWLDDLRVKLQSKYPSAIFAQQQFSFIPTYDVDMAWSYRQKGWVRNMGGLARQLVAGQLQDAMERVTTISGKRADPFDVFANLDVLHKKHRLEPVYFFLLAETNRGYDKNIAPSNPAFQQLIQQLAHHYATGIHLSWQAWQNEHIMMREKAQLERITATTVHRNRMHFIKFELPQTFRQLLSIGITEDHSMGYGSINGFRASTCRPFYWYDLEKEEITALKIFPFCYMEANSIFEQKDTPEKALDDMQYYFDSIKKLGGVFISIFHNHLIGTSESGRRWWRVYQQFLARNCTP